MFGRDEQAFLLRSQNKRSLQELFVLVSAHRAARWAMGTQWYATTFTSAFSSPCSNTALRSRVTNKMAFPAVPEEGLVDDLMEFANLHPFCGALLDDALRELGYVREHGTRAAAGGIAGGGRGEGA